MWVSWSGRVWEVEGESSRSLGMRRGGGGVGRVNPVMR